VSNLRLPLANRRDLMIFSFDEADGPIDVQGEKQVRNLLASNPCPAPPPLRVVPLSDREAYDEALRLALLKTPPNVLAVWVIDPTAARFGVRYKLPDGTEREIIQALRIIQVMTN
jgi:hypothetical protein